MPGPVSFDPGIVEAGQSQSFINNESFYNKSLFHKHFHKLLWLVIN